MFGPSSATGSEVQGNFIGTDVTGARGVPNTQDGIYFNGGNGATIGGPTAGTGNVISGNGGNGFAAYGTLVGSFQILGNRIGTAADGAARLGNSSNGVAFLNSGGNDVVSGNTVAFNGQAGVTVALGTRQKITGNSIFDNRGLGIDLDPCSAANCPGVNQNDTGDGDGGPNLFQNYPVISAVTSTDTSTTISGTLNSTANAPFVIEVFSSPACDDSGYGEGKKYLGSANVTTSGNDANFSVTVSPRVASSAVTATATDGNGNTSEFSACRSAPK